MIFSGISILAFLHIGISYSFTEESKQDSIFINVPRDQGGDNVPIHKSVNVADIANENNLSNSLIQDTNNSQKHQVHTGNSIQRETYKRISENHDKSTNKSSQRFEETDSQHHKTNIESDLGKNDKDMRSQLLNKRKRNRTLVKSLRGKVNGKNEHDILHKQSKPLSYGHFRTNRLKEKRPFVGTGNEKDNRIRNIPLMRHAIHRIIKVNTPERKTALIQNPHPETNELEKSIGNDFRAIDDSVRKVKIQVNKNIHRGKRSALNILNLKEIGLGLVPEFPKRQRTLSSRFYETLSSLVRLQMTYDKNLSPYPTKPTILLKPNLLKFLNSYGKRKFNSWGGKRDTVDDDPSLIDNLEEKIRINKQGTLQDASMFIDELLDTVNDMNGRVSLSDVRNLNGQKVGKRERQRQRRVFHPWAGK